MSNQVELSLISSVNSVDSPIGKCDILRILERYLANDNSKGCKQLDNYVNRDRLVKALKEAAIDKGTVEKVNTLSLSKDIYKHTGFKITRQGLENILNGTTRMEYLWVLAALLSYSGLSFEDILSEEIKTEIAVAKFRETIKKNKKQSKSDLKTESELEKLVKSLVKTDESKDSNSTDVAQLAKALQIVIEDLKK